jgi:hypothetical protein
VADRLTAAAAGHGAASAAELRFAASLAHRMIDYVGTVLDGGYAAG